MNLIIGDLTNSLKHFNVQLTYINFEGNEEISFKGIRTQIIEAIQEVGYSFQVKNRTLVKYFSVQ